MKYLSYKEKIEHGPISFPFALYNVTQNHRRYNMMLHWHNEYEIIKVNSGTLLLSIDGEQYKLHSGDIVILKDGVLHSGSPKDCKYQCLLFDLRFLLKDNFIGNKNLHKILNHEKNIQLFFTKDMTTPYKILEEIFYIMEEKEDGYEFKILGEFYNLLGCIERNNYYDSTISIAPKNKRRLLQLKKVLLYIESNYNTNIALDDLSRCANMNSNYFCKYFKEMTDRTPMEYLNYYRVELACDQITISDKTMTEIAFDCGFNDLSYFIKVFKKYKNITPYQYSKSISNI